MIVRTNQKPPILSLGTGPSKPSAVSHGSCTFQRGEVRRYNGYNFDVAYHVNALTAPMVWFTPGQNTKLGLGGVLLAAKKF